MSRATPSVRTRAAAPAPAPSPPSIPDPLVQELDGLRYALDAWPRRQGKSSVLTVRLAGGAGGASDRGPPLVDRCDLYSFRSRRGFAQLVADHFARAVDQILGHLALLLDVLERARAAADEPGVADAAQLTPERRAAAEALLRAPDLLERAAAAMTARGHVGDDEVKRLCFLVALSRLAPCTLSALLVAPTGAGKSTVLEAVAALVPPEHQVALVRLTAQSLFYAGPRTLRHKLLLVDEYEGQAEADHAVRVLQSKGELTQTATVKGRAERFTVKGPAAVMSGTTSSSAIDPQNASRMLLLALDDSPAQTRRIQQAQARAWAGADPARALDLLPWHDAQRLLAEDLPAQVAVPFAPELTLPARTSADRRLGPQLFQLVAAHALLHARQRARDHQGRTLAVPADYAAVHALLQPLSAHAQGEDLSPRAARALGWLFARGEPADRREVASALGWSYNTAKKALEELLAQELLRRVDPGPPARYRPLDAPALLAPTALTPPDALG